MFAQVAVAFAIHPDPLVIHKDPQDLHNTSVSCVEGAL